MRRGPRPYGQPGRMPIGKPHQRPATFVALLIELKAQFLSWLLYNRCLAGHKTCEMVNKSSKKFFCAFDKIFGKDTADICSHSITAGVEDSQQKTSFTGVECGPDCKEPDHDLDETDEGSGFAFAFDGKYGAQCAKGYIQDPGEKDLKT